MRVTGYVVGEGAAEAVDLQKKNIGRYAASLGYGIDEFVVEPEPLMKQPFVRRQEGARVVDMVEADDMVICGKAEWILASAQSGLELIDLFRRLRVSLYCVDLAENLSLPAERRLVVYEGGTKLVRGLLAALAACDGSKHGETIRAAKRQMKCQGKYLGGPVPFGWKVEEGFLVKDREQQKIITRIRKLRADRWSYRDIAVKLGNTFDIHLSHEGIRKILQANEGRRKD